MVVRSRITGAFRPVARSRADAERQAGKAQRARQKAADDRASVLNAIRGGRGSKRTKPVVTLATLKCMEGNDADA